MQKHVDYETGTLKAYRSKQRASEYKRYNSMGLTWGRFSTWREQRLLSRELSRYAWSSDDNLLDIPCGTGILGKLLHFFPFQIVASDISPEMMELAKEEYPVDKLVEFVQADITKTGFDAGSFACVVALGFLHRVPLEIKRATLHEIAKLTNNIAIVSCAVDTPLQRIKHKVLSLVRKKHIPAPCPVRLKEIVIECESVGFKVVRKFMIVPFFSAVAVLVLEKKILINKKIN